MPPHFFTAFNLNILKFSLVILTLLQFSVNATCDRSTVFAQHTHSFVAIHPTSCVHVREMCQRNSICLYHWKSSSIPPESAEIRETFLKKLDFFRLIFAICMKILQIQMNIQLELLVSLDKMRFRATDLKPELLMNSVLWTTKPKPYQRSHSAA